ncbi:MAG: ABC transporter ATP-binding protein [Spirochaetales bacterium]|nr:ABC transporter ATP-binding protein [Spirochaetales bacterium]
MLLRIRNLHTVFDTPSGTISAVDGASLDLRAGEILGIVGESGCGKTQLSLSVMRLVPSPPGRIADGEILFGGRDLLKLTEREMREVRGNEIAMIFQEPMTSLNPVYTIGYQLMETIQLHQKADRKEARAKAIEMLRLVGIPRAEEVIDEYPHRFSGGMRQRAMIAMALSCRPRLLIADEPTTALDVTIQAQILELMKELKDQIQTAIMFITHDLGVIAEMAQHVVVMYAGEVVEKADVETLFRNPAHPYTRGLIESRPTIEDDRERLGYITGSVPNPAHKPAGCPFHPRCPHAMEVCRVAMPPVRDLHDTVDGAEEHQVRCWLHESAEQRERALDAVGASAGSGVRS